MTQPPQRPPLARALFGFNLWLLGGFVAASACAIALRSLFLGTQSAWLALLFAAFSAAATRACWRRAIDALGPEPPGGTSADDRRPMPTGGVTTPGRRRPIGSARHLRLAHPLRDHGGVPFQPPSPCDRRSSPTSTACTTS